MKLRHLPLRPARRLPFVLVLLFMGVPLLPLPHVAGLAPAAAVAVGGGPRAAQPTGAAALRALLEHPGPESSLDAGIARISARMRTRLRAVYAQRKQALLWSAGGTPTPQALALLRALQHAADEGLRPGDYRAGALTLELHSLGQGGTAAASARSRAVFDWQLSLAASAFMTDLHCGRVDPRAAGFELPDRRAHFDAAALLPALATVRDPAAMLAALEPHYIHYRLLERALRTYRRLADEPGLTQLPPPGRRSVSIGQPYAGAAALHRLLAALHCLPAASAQRPPPGTATMTLDAQLVAGLRCFQALHGLTVDGVLGRHTYAALTTPLAQRVRQIELTLERWRWLPPLKPPTILVNIPQFRLYLLSTPEDREDAMLQMAVIVGREYPRMRTPAFAADMTSVILRPYWNVPRSILTHEILPLLARRPDYLRRQHMQIVRGPGDDSPVVPATPENLAQLAAGRLRLRQAPGPDNALGLIKFVLPNAYDVYLHSTPDTQLFGRTRRAFSHGCIRVAHPVALAQAVLQGTPGDWTRARILAAMHGSATLQVPLATPVHVLIVYGTAVALEDGTVHFFPDLYGQDRRLAQLLGLRAHAPAD